MSALPPPYDRQASFTSFHTEPAPTVGQDLEAEFSAIKQSQDATQARLREIQRDDGKLANESVHADALSQAVRALLSIDGAIRGAWAAGQVYDIGDTVEGPDGITYLCAVQHVANGNFTVDLNAGYWLIIDSGKTLDTALRAQMANAVTGATLIGYTPPQTGVAGTVKSFLDAFWANTGASLVKWIQTGTGAVARTLQEKGRDFLDVRDFGAVLDGVTNDTAAFNAAMVAAAAGGGRGTVRYGGGNVIVEAALQMQPGVRLLGDGKSVITQKNGANLLSLIAFGANAHGAMLENVLVDGNRAGNTDNVNNALISCGTSNDVTIKSCRITNSTGYLIHTSGLRATICDNRLSNSYMQAIGFYNTDGSGNAVNAEHMVFDNRIDSPGKGAMLIGGANYSRFERNILKGVIIGVPGNRLVVNISGNNVTRVSGPDFSTIKPGMTFVVNGGQEYDIVAVPSTTTLTLAGSALVLAGVQASAGSGDMIGLGASSYCSVSHNTVFGGATFGMGMVVGGANAPCSYNKMNHNTIIFSGKHAISIAYDVGAGSLLGNDVCDNKIFGAARAGGIGTGDKVAISIANGGTTKNDGVWVDGNSVWTTAGDGQTEYWLGTDGTGALGHVSVGRNNAIGMAFPGIKNAVQSVVLTGEWGNTASATNIVSNGHSVSLRVNSTGAGQAPGGTVTINQYVTNGDQQPHVQSKMLAGTPAIAPMWREDASTRAVWKGVFTGTPTVGGFVDLVFNS